MKNIWQTNCIEIVILLI